MKKLAHLFLATAAAVSLSKPALIQAQSALQNPAVGSGVQQSYSAHSYYANSPNLSAVQMLPIAVVNAKKCLEESKLGKQEKANFERMKLQMENVLQEKERDLEEIESKLDDDDYMDGVSDAVAGELKRKRRALRNELMQLQNQYLQTLQQANVKIVQKLTEVISKASAQVAQEAANTAQPIEVIFTDEACTFYTSRIDVSDRIVAKMNAIFDAEQKDYSSKSR